jgi:hypothetical protein
MWIHCRRNPFTEQFLSDSKGIVDVFTGRYQARAVVPQLSSRSQTSNRSIRHNI